MDHDATQFNTMPDARILRRVFPKPGYALRYRRRGTGCDFEALSIFHHTYALYAGTDWVGHAEYAKIVPKFRNVSSDVFFGDMDEVNDDLSDAASAVLANWRRPSSLLHHGPLLILSHLYIDAQHRGQGLGGHLLTATCSHLSRGCSALLLQCCPESAQMAQDSPEDPNAFERAIQTDGQRLLQFYARTLSGGSPLMRPTGPCPWFVRLGPYAPRPFSTPVRKSACLVP